MRFIFAALLYSCAFAGMAHAQDDKNTSSVTAEQRKAVSEERAAEVRAVLAAARKRQEGVDRHNTSLWARWTHAVCVGCGPTPKGLRIVYTNPHRVLQGIPAAEDDMRQQRGLRV